MNTIYKVIDSNNADTGKYAHSEEKAQRIAKRMGRGYSVVISTSGAGRQVGQQPSKAHALKEARFRGFSDGENRRPNRAQVSDELQDAYDDGYQDGVESAEAHGRL